VHAASLMSNHWEEPDEKRSPHQNLETLLIGIPMDSLKIIQSAYASGIPLGDEEIESLRTNPSICNLKGEMRVLGCFSFIFK